MEGDDSDPLVRILPALDQAMCQIWSELHHCDQSACLWPSERDCHHVRIRSCISPRRNEIRGSPLRDIPAWWFSQAGDSGCLSQLLRSLGASMVRKAVQASCSWRLESALELLKGLEVVARMPSFALTDAERQSVLLVIASRITDLLQRELSESLAIKVRSPSELVSVQTWDIEIQSSGCRNRPEKGQVMRFGPAASFTRAPVRRRREG